MNAKSLPCLLVAAIALLLAGCDYDAPLTAAPTHPVDPRLLGDWEPAKKDDPDEPAMHIRAWDDSTYAIAIDRDIYRVWHSDLAGQPFVSAQDLNTDGRKHCIYTWTLSADGTQLTLRRVRNAVIPDTLKTPAALQAALKEKLTDPQLFDAPLVFARQKAK